MTVVGTRITFDEAIAEALRMEMRRDGAVVLFSTSPGGVATGLASSFGPERVIETAAVGGPVILAASGIAGEGLRPVCELGPDQAGPGALDQIAELAAIHAANGGGATPLTVRIALGDRAAGGGAAGSDPLAWLIGVDGLKVVSPATPADAKGLTVAAIRDPEPVCVLEHTALRRASDIVPEDAHVVEIGRARLAREGTSMTVVAHGAAVPIANRAVAYLGLDADLIDLRTLQPLDTDAVLTSVKKTGRVLFMEPGAGAHRITAELVSAIWERAFDLLDAPPRRVRLASVFDAAQTNGDDPADDDVATIREVSSDLLAY